MNDRKAQQELTCPRTGKPLDMKWISKWSDQLWLAHCDCGSVHELVPAHEQNAEGK